MLRDLRRAARLLLQAKVWTAVVLLSLALGIGANTALFSVVNGLLLKTVPVRDADSLVRLRWYGPNDALTNHSSYGATSKTASGQDTSASFSYPMYRQFVASNTTLIDLVAGAPFGLVNVIVDREADLARSYISSGNYYQMLGIPAAAGRLLQPDDDLPGAPAVAVISHQYWRSRFGGDRQAIGKTIRVNQVPVTVVGVVPAAFTGIQQPLAEPPDVWLPLALHDLVSGGPSQSSEIGGPAQPGSPRLSDPTYWWLAIVGRVKPGGTPARVEANLAAVFQQTARADLDRYLASLTPEDRSRSENINRTNVPDLLVQPARRGIYDGNSSDLRSAAMLTAVVALVLLIVCANVSNLLLSRATTRQTEISIRLSMGATRWRLARQLLTESLLLASFGGALGVVVGYWGQQLLPVALGRPAPVDLFFVAFTIGIVTVTGVLVGLAPALTATRVSLQTTLKAQARGVIGSRRIFGKSLLVTQVALTLVLLVGSALFLRTIRNLREVDVGFNPANLVLFGLNPQLNRYEPAQRFALFDDLLERLRAVPGVRSAAFSQPALLAGSVNTTGIFVQGRTYARGARGEDSIHRVVVSPGFFETMEMPIRVGRGLTERDGGTAPRVVVINEAAARKYFPEGGAVGRRIGPNPEDAGRFEIVGVVRDARYNSLREPPPPTMYVPYRQSQTGRAVFEVRTAGDPARTIGAIRSAVRDLDPGLPLMNVTTQTEQIENRFQQEKVFAQAYTLFGVLALALAAIGLFGLMSYSVTRRINEIGIRLALGAPRRSVLALVMGESVRLVLIGVLVGIGIVVVAGRLVRSFLFGLPAIDVLSIGAAIAVMLAVSALAGYLPARRASRVDPLVALRIE